MSIYTSGEFVFKDVSKKVLKFARVSQDAPPDVLYTMMKEEWSLHVPNLLLSVTGGAKDFIMRPRLKNLFSKGLVKAAQTTGAWIITGGTHAGVMKHVGEAVRDFTRRSRSIINREIVVLGIAPWGVLHNRDNLEKEEGDQPAEYILDEKNQGRLCCLDTNHSHFILVDDGSEGKYGVEIPLRTQMEKYISDQTVTKGDSHISIPVVCVALEGGKGTLDTIHQSMNNNTPCVVVEGSGRVADAIARVANLKSTDITTTLVKDTISGLFEEHFTEEIIVEWTRKIQDIVGMSHLLTIFNADTKGAQDIDMAILQALLKASQSLGSKNWDYQLTLAVSWNRIHIAQDIFSSDWQWKAKDLHSVMTLALVENKPKFVQLFLDRGVSLREYVTPEVLTTLYNNIETSSIIYNKLHKYLREEELPPNLKDAPFHVANILKKLLGGFSKSPSSFTKTAQTYTETMVKVGTITLVILQVYYGHFIRNEHCDVEPVAISESLQYPIRDLLLWAVLQNRAELAEIFWSQSQDCIVGALACSTILRKISKEVEDTEMSEGMRVQARQYEGLAVGMLSECCKQNSEMSEKLLTHVSFVWGKTTCLRLAVSGHAMNFMSHGGVQMLLTKIWWGKLSVDNGFITVLLCMLCFPLVFTGLVTFRTEPVPHNMRLKPEPVKCHRCLVDFFTAPVVIFYWNVIAYIGFLWLFAYILMIDFQKTPSWREYLLYAWIFTIFCEELRQTFYHPDDVGCVKKCRLYILNFWNQVDVLALFLFSVGVICRLTQLTFYAGRIVLSLDFAIFCFRLMHIFAVSKVLGPKIIMMWRMIKDIFSFLFLLAVWIVSFGVSKQAITVHNEKRLHWIFWNVIYKPYLTLFGEIPSDVYAQKFNVTKCSPSGNDPGMAKCPYNDGSGNPLFPEWLTIILLCLYLLFANILLVNLLIAMFSYTFSEVQGNTDQIWRFQRLYLIGEYCSRPPAPPPFIILSHLYFLVKHAILCCPTGGRKPLKNFGVGD
ncbi:transient receptor potential cation channel subfamily M member 2-like [Lissotriton helveticus]